MHYYVKICNNQEQLRYQSTFATLNLYMVFITEFIGSYKFGASFEVAMFSWLVTLTYLGLHGFYSYIQKPQLFASP